MLGAVTIAPADIAALHSLFPASPAPAVPEAVETVRAMIPTNVVASAADGAVLPLVLIMLGYAVARFAGGVPIARFARAMAPAQAIAASTQSSIATLPAMMVSADRIGIEERSAAAILPMAVATFKITAPSNTVMMALARAWVAGVEISPVQLAVALPLAILSSLAILGMPGQISVYASVVPTAIALGAPLELLPILLAIDVIPDMFRTVANVPHDVAAAAAIAPPVAVDQ